MRGKRSKSSGVSKPGINEALKTLLESEEQPVVEKRGPGRPVKHRAETAAVILHLYKSQIEWLDDYAVEVESWSPENKRLSRAEIVRGFLLGLAQYAVERNLTLEGKRPIKSERDLQHALARALKGE